MTTVNRWTGHEAKLLRQALRLSVRDFAAHLGVGVRTVNKWEARQADITPLPHMQEVLDTALSRASDEAKSRFADSALLKRHDELVVAKHEYAASQSESSQADHPAPAEYLRSEQAVTSAVTASEAPGELVDDVGRDPVLSAPWNHRGTVKSSIALSGGDSPVERRRFALLTGAALTVPAHQWLIRDPEPLVSGLSGGRISVALVDQLPAMITKLRTMDDAAAHILGCMADQAARHYRPSEAVTLIETAVVGIRGWETPRLLAELYIRKAYALAALQDGSACVAAVAKARTQTEQFEPDSDPRWLYWVTPAEITAGAGDCLLQLGQPGRAMELLDAGIAMFDESFARDRQIYLTHLADAFARPGKQRDLDAAADRGLAAVHLAESVTSTRGIDCLRDLYRQIQPHASIPAVGDFLERARGVLAA